jgi:hypothetical protein
MTDQITEAELQKMITLRAIEWTNWPRWLSPLFVPIALIWIDWKEVILGQLVLDMAWLFVRYKFHSFKAADAGAMMVHIWKWPVAIIASVVLLWHRQYAISVLSLLWPILSGLFAIPGKRGLIELCFARDIGYVQDTTART